jgi:hypothetical protein
MKTSIRIVLSTIALLLAICPIILAETPTINQLYSKGTVRNYLFYIGDKQFGSLSSTFMGESDFDGLESYLFEEKLSLDNTPFGDPIILTIENNHFLDNRGFYLGDKMAAKFGQKEQELYLKRDGDSLFGHFINKGLKQDHKFKLIKEIRSIDNNFIDQMEIFLAFNNFVVGDTIIDSVFVPQILTTAGISFIVEDFRPVSYGDLVDSAYVLSFTKPTTQVVYYTRDNRIVRLDNDMQNISVILSEDVFERLKPESANTPIGSFIDRMPIYLVYLLFCIVFISPVISTNFKKPEIYLIFMLGAALFPVLRSTQIPLQKWYALEYLIPAVKSGGSIFSYGVISALIGGLIQEILKFVPILLVFIIRRPNRKTLIVAGMFCGLGFGFYEACSLTGAGYQSGIIGIFSWAVFERFFTMLFHTVTGTALGYALGFGAKRLIAVWAIMVIVHTLVNYSILFYQQGVVDLALFEILMSVFQVLFAMIVFFIVRKGYQSN